MDIIEHFRGSLLLSRNVLVIKDVQDEGLWKPIWHKTTQQCFMEMVCFCPQYYWNFLVLYMDIIEHNRVDLVI